MHSQPHQSPLEENQILVLTHRMHQFHIHTQAIMNTTANVINLDFGLHSPDQYEEMDPLPH